VKFINRILSNGLSMLIFLLFVVMPVNIWASDSEDDEAIAQMEELLEVGFEELAEITLTTASRKKQNLTDAPAAAYVISSEEIRRSGMKSIPELLRMVPGLDVARINNSTWAITSRGFNAQYSNKLLVLMDGRTIYSPLFAGVFWDVQDVMVDNIERIEVIRGSGGSLWGANAVNGVINIITKNSADTQGGLVSMGMGNVDKSRGAARYGGKVGKKSTFRFYAKEFDRKSLDLTSGVDANDGWDSQRGGFRADLHVSTNDTLIVQGDIYQLEQESTESTKNGGNLQLRWNRTLSDSSDLSLQLYYDRNVRTQNEERDTFDGDFQHRFSPKDSHEIIWGLGYRVSKDDMTNSSSSSWTPSSVDDETFSMFVQDEIFLVEDKLKLTIGTKAEHNDYTGMEYQPNARILWHIDPKQSMWAATSRAIRSPARIDRDFYLNTMTGATSTITINGNPDIQSEILQSYEIGYRAKPNSRLFFDVSTFYNKYDDVVSYETTASYSGGVLAIAQIFDNKLSATTYGVETAVDWQVNGSWKLRASHTWLKMNMELDADSSDTTISAANGEIPQNQLQVRSYYDIREDLEFDTSLYYVGELSNADIPAYTVNLF
jgi:iron complex outermembrane recepter protein